MTPNTMHRSTWLSWLALLPIGLLLFSGCGSTEANLPVKPAETSSPAAVSLVAAEERSLPTTLDVTGTLTADAQTDIASEIEQRVAEILVERGQYVGAGQVVARLDDGDAKNQLHEAEASEAQIRERLGLVNGDSFDPL